jgi:TetR/AcrR family transcriptional regulator, transcriptional repressor for nem operon
MINSALEVALRGRELRAFIARRFTEIDDFFCRSVRAAQAQIPKERSAKDLAHLLLGILLGIRVLVRSRSGGRCSRRRAARACHS